MCYFCCHKVNTLAFMYRIFGKTKNVIQLIKCIWILSICCHSVIICDAKITYTNKIKFNFNTNMKQIMYVSEVNTSLRSLFKNGFHLLKFHEIRNVCYLFKSDSFLKWRTLHVNVCLKAYGCLLTVLPFSPLFLKLPCLYD